LTTRTAYDTSHAVAGVGAEGHGTSLPAATTPAVRGHETPRDRPCGVSDLPDRLPRDDASLKALAKQLGCAKRDLLVLSPANDPYNMDTPTKRRDAEWFAGLWRDFGYTSGVHSRRVHYHASVQHAGEIRRPDGMPYVNDVGSWTILATAAVAARDLGVIDPALFDDRRNPESRVHTRPRITSAEPTGRITGTYADWSDPAAGYVTMPSTMGLTLHLPEMSLDVGHVEVDGYDYEADDQPYLLELWIEKSTMDDILDPVCRWLGVNYTPGKGFTSRTRVVEMLHRVRRHAKPVRVFVISDYDPAGSAMPRSIARVVEFYRDQIAPEVEIALHYIGMTREWADRYDLPRAPIKADDKRKANFEAVHGEGCVELDALEVLHPGALAREVENAVSAYHDHNLPSNLGTAEREAQAQADAKWHAITEQIRDEAEQIRFSVNTIGNRYRPRVDELRAEMRTKIEPLLARYREQAMDLAGKVEAEIEPYRARAAALPGELRDLADAADLDLPVRPTGDAPGIDESGWLYDSRRHWRDQLDGYRRDKSGGDADG
jgi:hypothetical protein